MDEVKSLSSSPSSSYQVYHVHISYNKWMKCRNIDEHHKKIVSLFYKYYGTGCKAAALNKFFLLLCQDSGINY